MDIKRTDSTFLPTQCSFLPDLHVLNEDVEKISLAKTILLKIIHERERNLLILERRVTDEKTKLHFCDHENRAIGLELSAVETKISEAFLLSQEAETNALETARENGAIKRKIIALKNDLEEQGRIIKKAKETMQAITKGYITTNKKLKVLPGVPP